MITSIDYAEQLKEINLLDYSEYDDLNNFDKEPIFVVDLNTRTIKVPSNFSPVAVVGDHCSETQLFGQRIHGQPVCLFPEAV